MELVLVVGMVGGGLDEKKHWCVDCAALLFSLMFPLLSAVELSAVITLVVKSCGDDKLGLSAPRPPPQTYAAAARRVFLYA